MADTFDLDIQLDSSSRSERRRPKWTMATYLLMIYVTLEQEGAIKELFLQKEWDFLKEEAKTAPAKPGRKPSRAKKKRKVKPKPKKRAVKRKKRTTTAVRSKPRQRKSKKPRKICIRVPDSDDSDNSMHVLFGELGTAEETEKTIFVDDEIESSFTAEVNIQDSVVDGAGSQKVEADMEIEAENPEVDREMTVQGDFVVEEDNLASGQDSGGDESKLIDSCEPTLNEAQEVERGGEPEIKDSAGIEGVVKKLKMKENEQIEDVEKLKSKEVDEIDGAESQGTEPRDVNRIIENVENHTAEGNSSDSVEPAVSSKNENAEKKTLEGTEADLKDAEENMDDKNLKAENSLSDEDEESLKNEPERGEKREEDAGIKAIKTEPKDESEYEKDVLTTDNDEEDHGDDDYDNENETHTEDESDDSDFGIITKPKRKHIRLPKLEDESDSEDETVLKKLRGKVLKVKLEDIKEELDIDWLGMLQNGESIPSGAPKKKKKYYKKKGPHVKKHKCELCEKMFDCPSNLAAHVRRHQGIKPFHCSICDKAFSNGSHLRRHELIHTGLRPYMCEFCGTTFNNPSHLKRHRLKHVPGNLPYKCDTCGKAYPEPGKLRSHIRTHTGERPFMCELCGKSYRDSSDLNKHRIVHTDGPQQNYRCLLCGKQYRCLKSFKSHEQKHIQIRERAKSIALAENGENGASYVVKDMPIYDGTGEICDLCGKEFITKEALRNHKRRTCVIKFSKESGLNMLKHACNECGKCFQSLKGLQTHQYQHNEPADALKIKCDLCGRLYHTRKSMLKHQRRACLRKHGQLNPDGSRIDGLKPKRVRAPAAHPKPPKPPQEKPTVDVQSKDDPNSMDYEYSYTPFAGNIGFPCDQCGKSYLSLETLNAHKEQHNNSNNRNPIPMGALPMTSQPMNLERHVDRHMERFSNMMPFDGRNPNPIPAHREEISAAVNSIASDVAAAMMWGSGSGMNLQFGERVPY